MTDWEALIEQRAWERRAMGLNFDLRGAKLSPGWDRRHDRADDPYARCPARSSFAMMLSLWNEETLPRRGSLPFFARRRRLSLEGVQGALDLTRDGRVAFGFQGRASHAVECGKTVRAVFNDFTRQGHHELAGGLKVRAKGVGLDRKGLNEVEMVSALGLALLAAVAVHEAILKLRRYATGPRVGLQAERRA